jgi:release factor glutamine methyltransferase
VVASDIDPRSVECARDNGVEAYLGDLFDPLPAELAGEVAVVVGVVPYVPSSELRLLQRDTMAFESARPYDGGPDGCDILRRATAGACDWLRPGGALLLEVGGDQAEALAGDLQRLGYLDIAALADDEGDVRGIEATCEGAGGGA